MKIEEAIVEIRESGLYGNQVYMETLQLALEALEKQVVRRPWMTSLGWDYGDSYRKTVRKRPDCPVCGHFLKTKDGMKFKYCPECGVKIDWKE